jgi:ankyrin repeat protein
MQYLVSKGAVVKAQNTFGTSILHVAVESKHEHIVDFILSKGFNVLVKDRQGKMAIDIAIQLEQWKIVNKLLERHILFEKQYPKPSDEAYDCITTKLIPL